MVHVIEYFKEGRQIGTTPWPGSLEVTIKVARAGCKRQGADFVRVVDVSGGNAEVWSEKCGTER